MNPRKVSNAFVNVQYKFQKVFQSFNALYTGMTETPKKNEIEPILGFNHILITYISPFEIKLTTSEEVKESFEQVSFRILSTSNESEYLRQFQISDDFHLPSGYALQTFSRFELPGFSMKLPKKEESPTFDIKVFLSIYHKIGIGVIEFAFDLSNYKFDVDDLIFIEHTLYRERYFELILSNKPKISTDIFTKDKYSLRSMMNIYKQTIQKILPHREVHNIERYAKCIEIRKILVNNSKTKIEPLDILNISPKEMYGLLCSDEGWRFVPLNLAKERIENNWGSRNFVIAIPHGTGIISVNLWDSDIHKAYRDSQKEIREKFGQKVEDYFYIDFKIGGLAHGFLILLESTLIQRYLIDIIDSDVKQIPKDLKEIAELHTKLTKIMEKLRFIRIPEMEVIGKKLNDSIGLDTSYTHIQERLDEIESALSIGYNRTINKWIFILTIVTIFLGLLSLNYDNFVGIYNVLKNFLQNFAQGIFIYQ